MLTIKIKVKSIFAVTLIFSLFLGLSLVSANDINMDENLSLQDNTDNLQINYNLNNDVEDTNDNQLKNTDTSISDDEAKVKDSNGILNFSSLNETINSESLDIIELENDYAYNDDTDSRFIDQGGIIIERDLTIDGHGHTIDLGGKLRFLKLSNYFITLKNINIINGYSKDGGAVSIENGTGSFLNCSFSNNTATNWGGVVYISNGTGTFINSTFISNKAGSAGGVAIYKGGNCTFIECNSINNHADDCGGVFRAYDAYCIFKNSNFLNNTAGSGGGAIYIYNYMYSRLEEYFVNSTFTSNTAEGNAGAIYFVKGKAFFIESNFTDNHAKSANGGAIDMEGDGTFLNTIFADNSGNFGCNGGAVCINYGAGNFTNSIFRNNSGSFGGAIYLSRDCFFTNTTFLYNHAEHNGGAVRVDASDKDVIFKDSTFIGNIVQNGGGGAVYFNEGRGSFVNSTFTDNKVTGIGGAIYLSGDTNQFIDSTFNNNSATYGGAIYYSSGNGIFTNSSFSDNDGNIGGAVYLGGDGTFTNTIFIANNASGYGGALYIRGKNINFIDSIFKNNFGYYGGTIYINGTNVTIKNSTFSENCAFNGGSVFLDSGLINVTISSFKDNFSNIVYKMNNESIFVDEDTRALSDLDLICKLTNLNINLDNYTYGDTGSIFCNVSFADETVVDDGLVYVIIGNMTYMANITGGSGVIELNDLNAGIYTLYVIYNGTTTFAKSMESVNLTVYKKTIDMIVSANNITYGESAVVTVNLNESLEGIVSIYYNDKNYTANVTGGTGEIYIPGLDAGDYIFNVTFIATNYDAPVQNVDLTVFKNSTSITAAKSSFIINYGGFYKIIIHPNLAGLKITFKLNGKSIGSAFTDVSGLAKININAAKLKSAGAGTHNIVAIFQGNNNLIGSNATGKITINKEATKFINVKSVKKTYKITSRTMQLTATLKNSKNKPIKNQIVYFKVNNKKTYKVKTNSKGVAKLTLNLAKIRACKLNKKGTYRFTVTYKNTKTYKQSRKNGKIKVVR